LTSRRKSSIDGQLFYSALSFGIFDYSPGSKAESSVHWPIEMTATTGFKLQVKATPGFHILNYQCYQTMWQVPGAPDNSDDDTVIGMHCTDTMYSAAKSLIDAIRTEDEVAQQDAVLRMIQIAMCWTISRWLESEQANGKPLVWKPNDIAHHPIFRWTEVEQANLKTLVEKYTSWGASDIWRMNRWPLA
jgi:hypothetical protein